MREDLIKKGGLYRNGGAGTTLRKVLDMGVHCMPGLYFGDSTLLPVDAEGVEYTRVDAEGEPMGMPDRLYLKSFAKWAGSRVD